MDVLVYSYKKHIIFPLLLGMISGSLLFILGYNQFNYNDIISNIYILGHSNIDNNSYIIYLVQQRIIILVVFLIFVILVSYKFASILFNYIFGIYYDIMASTLFVEYGYSSYRILITIFLIQYILYFISMLIGGVIFSGNKISNSTTIDKSNILNFFVKIIFIVVLLFISVGSEMFFVKKF